MKVKKAFWIFVVLTILDEIDDRILFVILPFFLLAKDFSASQIGLVFSIASIILLFSRILIGKLSDIFGRKNIFSLGLFGNCNIYNLISFLINYNTILFSNDWDFGFILHMEDSI